MREGGHDEGREGRHEGGERVGMTRGRGWHEGGERVGMTGGERVGMMGWADGGHEGENLGGSFSRSSPVARVGQALYSVGK